MADLMTPDAAILSAARARWDRQQERVSSKWPRIPWDELTDEVREAQVAEMRRIASDLLFEMGPRP